MLLRRMHTVKYTYTVNGGVIAQKSRKTWTHRGANRWLNKQYKRRLYW